MVNITTDNISGKDYFLNATFVGLQINKYPTCIITQLYFRLCSVHASSIFPVSCKLLLLQENSAFVLKLTVKCEFLGGQVIIGTFCRICKVCVPSINVLSSSDYIIMCFSTHY